MGGTVCLIIIRGNRTQANARSLATSEIIEAMTPEQQGTAARMMRGIATVLSSLIDVHLRFPPAAPEPDILVTSRFAIASAASVCDLAYEFLTPVQQQQATDFMQQFNDASDQLLAAIAANT